MNIFMEIGLIIFITTVVSIAMRLLKQPLIVGYILSGIIVGPYFLNLIESASYIELFSKFGIAILLFIVGLNLKPDIIREVGKVAIIVGIGQIIFTSVVGFLIIKILGFGLVPSILGAIALTFSSTIIVLKLITDEEDLNKTYAKVSIGMLLVQDIVATLVLLFLSISGSHLMTSGNIAENVLILLGKGIVFFLILYLISKYVLPKFLIFLAKSQELLFLFSISWGIGLASIFHELGFSLEIGALAAGIALASSIYSQEVGSRLKPLRDFFILLFFVMLGSQLVLASVGSVIIPAIILSIFVLVGNPIIVMILMNFLGYKGKTSFQTGLTVAQISEFSLILITLGYSFNYLSKEFVSLITLVGVITIAGSTYLFIYSEKIYNKIKPILKIFEFKNVKKINEVEPDNNADLVIFGYDRVGFDFVSVAEKNNMKYFVVDYNPISINKLSKSNIPYFFGDADDFDFLDEINVSKVKSVISTIPDFKTNLNLVSYCRNKNKDLIIIVISHSINDTLEFYRKGASYVIMPHYLGAKHAAQMFEKYNFNQSNYENEKNNQINELEARNGFTMEK